MTRGIHSRNFFRCTNRDWKAADRVHQAKSNDEVRKSSRDERCDFTDDIRGQLDPLTLIASNLSGVGYICAPKTRLHNETDSLYTKANKHALFWKMKKTRESTVVSKKGSRQSQT